MPLQPRLRLPGGCADTPAGDLVRPILGADKALIADARVFDVYQGQGVPEG
jgi:phenylalanyl-tRNA synthetase beta chain